MSFAVRPRADQDLNEIADYLAEGSGLDIALHFLTQAHETFGLLASQPGLGWACRLRHRDLAARLAHEATCFARVKQAG